MERSSPFSLSDACASCVLVLLVIGFTQVIMGCGGGGGISEREENLAKTQIRGIIQGLINYSPGNNDIYPGLTRSGEDKTLINPNANQFGVPAGVTGFDPAYRYAILFRSNYISPEFGVSPIDVDAVQPAVLMPAKGSKQKAGEITASNFSFAMLELKSLKGRNEEWRSTVNSKAVVISDRNTGPDADAGVKSLVGSPWSGIAGYNDNHVMFEKSHVLPNLKYGSGGGVTADNLFKTGDPLDGPAKPHSDAYMTYKSPDDGGVNQNP